MGQHELLENAFRGQPAPNCRLSVGSYQVPFFGYSMLVFGTYSLKVGYPTKGPWYEPTGTETVVFFRAVEPL